MIAIAQGLIEFSDGGFMDLDDILDGVEESGNAGGRERHGDCILYIMRVEKSSLRRWPRKKSQAQGRGNSVFTLGQTRPPEGLRHGIMHPLRSADCTRGGQV
jgi:hypothetical protein